MSSPNRIFGHYTADACVADDQPLFTPANPAEELVCRADSFTAASPVAASSRPSLRTLFHRHADAQRLLGDRTDLVASAFGSTSAPRRRSSSAEGLAVTPFAVLGTVGCANEGPIDDIPDDPVENPPTDNPPVQTGGENGGLGEGIQTMFATSRCRNPLDLDLASAAGSVIMTCGDSSGEGNAILEILNASSGGTPTVRSLPAFLGGSMSKPIHLLSSATGDSGIIYASFASSRSTAELESEHSPIGLVPSLSNSGIYTTNEAGTGTVAVTSFDPIEIHPTGSAVIPFSLAGLNGADATLPTLQPNNPVSMLRIGNRVIVLNNNRIINTVDGTLDYAPATVHRYTINPSTGALVPESAGEAFSAVVKAGTSTTSNAALLDGYYNATALGMIDANRFGVVVQGLPGENSSGIHILNAADLQSGLPEDPDRSGSFIAFADAPDPANPDVDFVASDSSQLTVVHNRYALVGSFDGTGRIAVVDCNTEAAAPGASRIRYIRVFDDGSDIANIVAHPNGDFAYVISDTGKIRAVTLAEGPNYGRVGETFTLANFAPGSVSPAIYAADSVVAAYDRAYAKAPISLR